MRLRLLGQVGWSLIDFGYAVAKAELGYRKRETAVSDAESPGEKAEEPKGLTSK